MNLHKTRAFTLIELLIVVAIIAILAAIAVPNFLEAQTRAKVSRAKADLRSMATAIESYHVDHNRYPPAQYLAPRVLTLEDRWAFLTTPVAYVTSVPLDPFGDTDVATSIPPGPGSPIGKYRVFDFVINIPGHAAFFNAVEQNLGLRGGYYIASQGPDLAPELTKTPSQPGVAYDPTNGTISEGDIIRISDKQL